ncbi:leucyl/phenylalanyl-tRNA--protein transferase [Labrys sp. KNU-23]|uniref:leucyl/phenylalanyl-tRNA--protein transferase n=1 Tax=Labrys sp. KNU-23 TaxID=2789216 RepID=UPI0011EEA141|nr:leucyl/phenylalanyl-tRNA--protein transferase [Labrys sp. KNU-23]QEN86924.1 leucyl/phenylalanyl-tRNA--protein transferase [Labrys sp. KNU-23]
MSGAEVNLEITPQVLLKAYACGIFPMAESADDPGLYWVEPEFRGVVPLDGLIISHRLARTIRSDRFEIVVDRDFEAVIDGCAQSAPGRRTTWINASIRKLYGELFRLGHCHTVEAYRDGRLVGGLYGVDLGGAFFGESMFHRESDASKVALAHLVARLRHGGYQLLDTQFVTDHLTSLGAVELPRSLYHQLLDDALAEDGDFLAWPKEEARSGAEILAALAD